MKNSEYDWLIVGAGITGLTFARKMKDAGKHVIVVDSLPFIGGLCHDHYENLSKDYSTDIHDFGPHIFHTGNETVKEFIKKYGEWIEHKHEVKALVKGKYYNLPVNNLTASQLGMRGGALANIDDLKNIFMKEYTEKQWGMPFDEVPKETLGRFTVHDDTETNYFGKEWTAFPKKGYTEFFNNLSKGIKVVLNMNGQTAISLFRPDKVYWTGRIDTYYDYSKGKLEFRSTSFEREDKENNNSPDFIVNFPEKDIPFTRRANYDTMERMLEGKEATYDKHSAIIYERPNSGTLSLYPVRTNKNLSLYKEYADEKSPNVVFAGRAGTFSYMDMDDCVLAAIEDANKYAN